jgi:dsDNA-specific endonuclease/ATPase MutS2
MLEKQDNDLLAVLTFVYDHGEPLYAKVLGWIGDSEALDEAFERAFRADLLELSGHSSHENNRVILTKSGKMRREYLARKRLRQQEQTAHKPAAWGTW